MKRKSSDVPQRVNKQTNQQTNTAPILNLTSTRYHFNSSLTNLCDGATLSLYMRPPHPLSLSLHLHLFLSFPLAIAACADDVDRLGGRGQRLGS
jgi:hypothetical protein